MIKNTTTTILILIFLIVLVSGCKPEKEKKMYYVISKHMLVDMDLKNEEFDNELPPPPPPPPLVKLGRSEIKWYTDVVLIFDSTDMVYIYQTEIKNLDEKIKFTAPEVNINNEFDESEINKDTMIYETEYPNFIGLRPENLMAIESKNLLSFLRLNNDIIDWGKNKEDFTFFYFASNQDTIFNEVYYKLQKAITEINREKLIIGFTMRITTEEENMVIDYKRKNREYYPENLAWSNNFIDGKVKPFTKEYYSLENRTFNIAKAKETFKVNRMVRYGFL